MYAHVLLLLTALSANVTRGVLVSIVVFDQKAASPPTATSSRSLLHDNRPSIHYCLRTGT